MLCCIREGCQHIAILCRIESVAEADTAPRGIFYLFQQIRAIFVGEFQFAVTIRHTADDARAVRPFGIAERETIAVAVGGRCEVQHRHTRCSTLFIERVGHLVLGANCDAIGGEGHIIVDTHRFGVEFRAVRLIHVKFPTTPVHDCACVLAVSSKCDEGVVAVAPTRSQRLVDFRAIFAVA